VITGNKKPREPTLPGKFIGAPGRVTAEKDNQGKDKRQSKDLRRDSIKGLD
jgi:hypothetical protein